MASDSSAATPAPVPEETTAKPPEKAATENATPGTEHPLKPHNGSGPQNSQGGGGN